MTQAAQAAKAIRKELKEKFPQGDFRVRSENFSMGDAVNVYILEGTADRTEVQKTVSKYQYGHFDGMTDCYEYSNRRDDLPQAKWVHAESLEDFSWL